MSVFQSLPSALVIIVQPGFNGQSSADNFRALRQPADPSIFDPGFLKVTEDKKDFVLVLGSGFETADVAQGFIMAPCAGLPSIEQLRFLQGRGMRAIVMARPHGTLVQNARSVGIEVIFGGQ